MGLRDFVSQSLVEIIDGVRQAQTEVDNLGGTIVTGRSGDMDQTVQFDVQVTTTDETGTQSGVGLFVGPVALGTREGSTSENTSDSRIKFTVPVSLPIHSATIASEATGESGGS